MVRALVIVTALLMSIASSAWAYRIMEQPEDAYELDLGAVRLPASENGTVVLTPCEDCRTTVLRVNEQTGYFANGSQMSLKDLKDIVDDLLVTTVGREDTIVYVYYDVASQRVNRLAISYRT